MRPATREVMRFHRILWVSVGALMIGSLLFLWIQMLDSTTSVPQSFSAVEQEPKTPEEVHLQDQVDDQNARLNTVDERLETQRQLITDETNARIAAQKVDHDSLTSMAGSFSVIKWLLTPLVPALLYVAGEMFLKRITGKA